MFKDILHFILVILEYIANWNLAYLLYTVPAVIIFITFLKRNRVQVYIFLAAVLKFIRDSLLTDGKPDATKIIAFSVTNFCLMPICVYCATVIKDAWHLIILVSVIAVFILVLLRIILPAHLLELKNGTSFKEASKP